LEPSHPEEKETILVFIILCPESDSHRNIIVVALLKRNDFRTLTDV
jgi:hypothetical protein